MLQRLIEMLPSRLIDRRQIRRVMGQAEWNFCEAKDDLAEVWLMTWMTSRTARLGLAGRGWKAIGSVVKKGE